MNVRKIMSWQSVLHDMESGNSEKLGRVIVEYNDEIRREGCNAIKGKFFRVDKIEKFISECAGVEYSDEPLQLYKRIDGIFIEI